MFVSAGRPLAVGEKIIRISSRTAGPGALKKDHLLALFGLSTPFADFIVNYIAFLSPAYDGACLGLQNLYWTCFARGHRLGARPLRV